MAHKLGEIFSMDGHSFEVIGYDYEGRVIAKRVESKISAPLVMEEPENDITNYESMGIKDLQALCKEKGLTIRGSKADVIERLKGAE